MKRVERVQYRDVRRWRGWRVMTRHGQTVYCSSLLSALWWRFSK